jgi:hypothetical protein
MRSQGVKNRMRDQRRQTHGSRGSVEENNKMYVCILILYIKSHNKYCSYNIPVYTRSVP